MIETIRKYIKKYQMIAPGDTVCVGLSGGADSVCLLLVLLELYGSGSGAAGHSPKLMAVHVNHQLRGDAADADERFAGGLCEKYQIPLYKYRYPVAEIAAEKGIGTEEAGRLIRQEAYRDCLIRHGASVIALAHHANDRAETFLFHAARGTSLAGLAGIRPVQPFALTDGQSEQSAEKTGRTASIIRPLLCVSREEIEAWLISRGQPWRTDETNLNESYTRNAIRHSVIPLLEKQINRQTVRHIAEVSSDLDEADRFLREEALRRAAQYVQQSGQCVRVLASIEEQPAVLQGYILLDVLERAGGSRKDLGREQVRQLRELFRLHTGKQTDLPYGLCAAKEAEGIRIFRRKDKVAAADKNIRKTPDPVPVAGAGTYIWGRWRFRVRILEAAAADEFRETYVSKRAVPRKKYTKWMDCDKINGILCIRSRLEGDRMVVNAQGGSRKLKDYLIDEKIPREERNDIPLLASGRQVLWVVGHRISEEIKVTERTKHILEITAEPFDAGQTAADRSCAPGSDAEVQADIRERKANVQQQEKH